MRNAIYLFPLLANTWSEKNSLHKDLAERSKSVRKITAFLQAYDTPSTKSKKELG